MIDVSGLYPRIRACLTGRCLGGCGVRDNLVLAVPAVVSSEAAAIRVGRFTPGSPSSATARPTRAGRPAASSRCPTAPGRGVSPRSA